MFADEDIVALEDLLEGPSGQCLERFRTALRSVPDDHPWRAVFNPDSEHEFRDRSRDVYRVWFMHKHANYRSRQLREGGFTALIYRTSSCEEHAAFDRLVLPADHPFWTVFKPPNGTSCDCKIYGCHTAAGARRRGGDPDKPWPGDISSPEGLERLSRSLAANYRSSLPPDVRSWLREGEFPH